MIFIKSRADFRNLMQVEEKSYELYTDSFEEEVSQSTFPPNTVDQDNVEDWAVWNRYIYRIDDVGIDDAEITVGLADPLSVFDRDVWYNGTMASATATAEFINALIDQEWVTGPGLDPEYALTYLNVRNYIGETDPTFIKPSEVKRAEENEDPENPSNEPITFNVYEYFKMLRDAYGFNIRMALDGNDLVLLIGERMLLKHNVMFGDGNSILESQTFGNGDTTAKVTVIFDEDDAQQTGKKFDYYLTEAGEMSEANVIPTPRVKGKWVLITASKDTDESNPKMNAMIAKEEAEREFGENSGGMKIEFWTNRKFELGDRIEMNLNGKLVKGRISSIKIRSDNIRWYVTVGDLATSLTDKLKRKG